MKKLLWLLPLIILGGWFWLKGDTEQPRWPTVTAPESLRTLDSGSVVGFASAYDTYGWLGIPYAAPPVAELRWRAPRAANPWSQTLEALAPGNVCPQIGGRLAGVPESQFGTVVGDEDCLVLHLWAPKSARPMQPGQSGLPVMVWIHGGGNTIGYGADYDGSRLAGEHNVVVVAINYRLGVLGWLSHEGLRQAGASPEDASGNFGTLDTIFALAWIRDNIAAFGGDKHNVTVFGESAGGRNIYALLDSPRAEGLFHRAIVQSGATRRSSRTESEAPQAQGGHPSSSFELVTRWLVKAGHAAGRDEAVDLQSAQSPAALLAMLRRQSPTFLMEEFAGLSGMYSAPQLFKDGVVLPDRRVEEAYLDTGSYNAVPVITGTNRDEAKLFLAQNPALTNQRLGVFVRIKNPEEYQKISDYLSLKWKATAVDMPAAAMRKAQGPTVFAYRFDWDEGSRTIFADFGALLGAAHGLEIPFIFGDFSDFFGRSIIFGDESEQGRTQLSKAMMSYWAEFAHTGDPGRGRKNDLPRWQAWSDDIPDSRYLILDTQPDGGIRMDGALVTMADLKTRLLSDTSWEQPSTHCLLFAQMFWATPQWDRNEYDNLNSDCSTIDPQLATLY